ncbi:MAG: insulinase family protein, partial [Clostridia bacterium]|nr:insulinase family protein [Clostridia bacterium]
MKLQTFKIKDGVTLNYLKTDKFKTTNLSFFINRPLTEEEVTINALLSLVLKRSCPMYKTSMELNNALNDLYGAVIDTGIKKKGANQFIVTSFSFVNEKFIPGKPPIIDEIFAIAKDLLLSQSGFNDEYVSQEKENLKSLILSQKNDKRLYAQARCIEEMCKGEPTGIMRYGYVDKVDGITNEQLFTHYKNTVLKSGVDVFICGDVDIDKVLSLVNEMYKEFNIKFRDYIDLAVKTEVSEVKDITETEEIAQGKLSIGFRTGLTSKDRQYPALMMYNAILGSGIFSKLFNNVREKLSLCYYASSSVDSISGTMYINSGIEVANFK